MRLPALLLASLFAVPALAGCLSSDAPDSLDDDHAVAGLTSVFDRAGLPFDLSDVWSHPLVEGAYGILEPVSVFVDVPLPPTEGGAALDPATPPVAHLGLFLPDIPGCDFSHAEGHDGMVVGKATTQHTEEVAHDCRVPVIADVGPYYSTPGSALGATEGDVPADQRGSGRLGEFLISNFVPQGYAVAQVSVMGSGQSTHCFDMFGMAEQLGVHHAVEWLGTQSWSNGNVGLIGRSYDGSTPWMAAAHGSEHLKTIVPISGLIGLKDLVTWNGASEARVLTFHNVIYGQFGLDGDAQDVHSVCPDAVTAAPFGAAGYATGDHVIDQEGTYWVERSFLPRVLQNYEGSVYLIHGLQDDNVDPHAGWPAQVALQEKGLEVKGLYGQWQHMYPDRYSEHSRCGACPSFQSVRMDWAQDLLEWFDHYLKETGPKPPLHTEIQQLDGRWRVEPNLTPPDAVLREVPLGTGTVSVSAATDATAQQPTVLDLGVLSETEETVLGGLSSVRLTVTPTSVGGQVYVELRDLTEGTDLGLSYGVMELRQSQAAGEGVVPGQALEIEVPLQLFDAALPAGHKLGMLVAESGNGFLPGPVQGPVTIDLAQSTLVLSTLERGPEAYFTPPVWYELDADGNPVAPET